MDFDNNVCQNDGQRESLMQPQHKAFPMSMLAFMTEQFRSFFCDIKIKAVRSINMYINNVPRMIIPCGNQTASIQLTKRWIRIVSKSPHN